MDRTADFLPVGIPPRVRQLIRSSWTLAECFVIVAVSREYVELVAVVLLNYEPEPEPLPLEIQLFPSLAERDRYYGVERR